MKINVVEMDDEKVVVRVVRAADNSDIAVVQIWSDGLNQFFPLEPGGTERILAFFDENSSCITGIGSFMVAVVFAVKEHFADKVSKLGNQVRMMGQNESTIAEVLTALSEIED